MKTEFYFHSKTTPRVTVAAVLNPATQVLTFGKFEFNEKPFCRKIGRAAAIGRVYKGKTVGNVPVNVYKAEVPGRVFVQKCLEICNIKPELVEA